MSFGAFSGEGDGMGGFNLMVRGPSSQQPPVIAARRGANHTLDPVLEEALSQPGNKDTLLRMERDVLGFLKDQSAQRYTLPAMGSYHRLMLHRLAEYYCMEHDVEHWLSEEDQRRDRQPITLYKHPGTRMPDTLLRDHSDRINGTAAVAQPKQVKMLRRASTGAKPRGQASSQSSQAHPSGQQREQTERKTIEQKEREYAQLRARIMAGEDSSPGQAASPQPEPERAPTTRAPPQGLASAPDGSRGFGRGRGRGRGRGHSGTASAEPAVGANSGAPPPGPADPVGQAQGGGTGRGRLDPAQLKANIASRQERWQELQHDPDFDRSYARYAPRNDAGRSYGQPYSDSGGYAVHAPLGMGALDQQPQNGYSLFGGAAQPRVPHAGQDMWAAPRVDGGPHYSMQVQQNYAYGQEYSFGASGHFAGIGNVTGHGAGTMPYSGSAQQQQRRVDQPQQHRQFVVQHPPSPFAGSESAAGTSFAGPPNVGTMDRDWPTLD